MRIALLGIVLSLTCSSYSVAQLDDLVKKAEGSLQQNNPSQQRDTSGLSDDKIAGGLKQALQISTSKAVAAVGQPDGFLKNEAIKILLPPRLQTAGKAMKMMGMGAPVDELETGMNRAAEQASPQAKEIFLAALHKMSFEDARHILTGGDTAATDYFKRVSSADLTTAFSPIVHTSMQHVGVVQRYNQFLETAPGGKTIASEFDLDKYVVGKTLDGLFYTLGQEEAKIRTHPMAQTTALLKEVFGRK